MLIPRISYLAALEPVWFHSVLEPFPKEDRSQEQLELNVFKKTTVSLDHIIKHYSVQLELNWLNVCFLQDNVIHRINHYPVDNIIVDKTNYAIHCFTG